MKYEITKEQIKQLSSQDQIVEEYLEEWFPEAFESKFEIGKWYKITTDENYFLNWQGEYKQCYGILAGRWDNKYFFYEYHKKNSVPATESEVFEALKKEAVKRGFINGAKYLSPTDQYHGKCTDRFDFSFKLNVLYNNNFSVFTDGKWAEIIKEKTLSKSEAEAKLNELINDGYDYKIG